MNLIEVFVLAVGLSMDAFAVSIGKGLGLREKNPKYGLLCGIWFGAFQALMPAIGYFAGSRFTGMVQSVDHWIVFAILALLGINMIRSSRKEPEEVDPSFGPLTMLALAIATSIDALAAGISFALMKVALVTSVLLIGVTTFCFSFVGVTIGTVLGSKFRSAAEAFGGIVLIAIGIKVLVTHLVG